MKHFLGRILVIITLAMFVGGFYSSADSKNRRFKKTKNINGDISCHGDAMTEDHGNRVVGPIYETLGFNEFDNTDSLLHHEKSAALGANINKLYSRSEQLLL